MIALLISDNTIFRHLLAFQAQQTTHIMSFFFFCLTSVQCTKTSHRPFNNENSRRTRYHFVQRDEIRWERDSIRGSHRQIFTSSLPSTFSIIIIILNKIPKTQALVLSVLLLLHLPQILFKQISNGRVVWFPTHSQNIFVCYRYYPPRKSIFQEQQKLICLRISIPSTHATTQ